MVTRLTPEREAEIRKLNAGKAWGHSDSAVQHVSELLSELVVLRVGLKQFETLRGVDQCDLQSLRGAIREAIRVLSDSFFVDSPGEELPHVPSTTGMLAQCVESIIAQKNDMKALLRGRTISCVCGGVDAARLNWLQAQQECVRGTDVPLWSVAARDDSRPWTLREAIDLEMENPE